MTDESVVVDNGQTYVSEETAVVATEAANRAKQWAQESERQANIATSNADTAVNAKDAAVSAKEYAEAAITDTNMVTVATDLRSTPSNIKTVVNNISNVNTVAGISTAVSTVADNDTNITTVVTNISDISTTATNISAINTNAANITDIQNASSNADLAKKYAVGLPTEPEEKSAKWWAEYAEEIAQTVGNPANRDLSNLTAAGQAVLDANVVNVLKSVYPVGAVYIGTTSTCPLASFFGTWTLKSSGRVLQGADSTHTAGTTIEAGLPNITGSFRSRPITGTGDGAIVGATGAFTHTAKGGDIVISGVGLSGMESFDSNNFDASRSSSIYGNSTTVQPPAYVVNIWERTA